LTQKKTQTAERVWSDLQGEETRSGNSFRGGVVTGRNISRKTGNHGGVPAVPNKLDQKLDKVGKGKVHGKRGDPREKKVICQLAHSGPQNDIPAKTVVLPSAVRDWAPQT